MEKVDKLPSGKPVIGARQVAKAAAAGKVKHIIVASNCPSFLLSNMEALKVKTSAYSGDQRALGTALGKSFDIAVAGFEE